MRFLIVFIHQTKAIVNKGIVKKGNKGMFEISSKLNHNKVKVSLLLQSWCLYCLTLDRCQSKFRVFVLEASDHIMSFIYIEIYIYIYIHIYIIYIYIYIYMYLLFLTPSKSCMEYRQY